MWINDALANINDELHKVEQDKRILAEQEAEELVLLKQLAADLTLNPKSFRSLEESDIWSRTAKENEALQVMYRKLHGYVPKHEVQRTVLRMVMKNSMTYVPIDYSQERIESYLSKSIYWIKRDVTLTPLNGDKEVNIVYADNEDMQCIIFQYLNRFVVSTYSSFENFIRQVEGKFTEQAFVDERIPEPTPANPKQSYDADTSKASLIDQASMMKTIDAFNHVEEEPTEVQEFLNRLDMERISEYQRNLL